MPKFRYQPASHRQHPEELRLQSDRLGGRFEILDMVGLAADREGIGCVATGLPGLGHPERSWAREKFASKADIL